MDSRLAVLARMEDSSPRPRVRFSSGLLILQVKSAVEPFNCDEKKQKVLKMGSVEILSIFFLTLLGATARNASAPAAVASPLER